MRRAAPLALLSLTGCFRLYDLVDAQVGGLSETAQGPAATPAAAEAERRSYGNPDTQLTEVEQRDISELCRGVVAAEDQQLQGPAEASLYGSLDIHSDWGHLMQKHLQANGRRVVGPRLARLLEGEGLKWSTADCRTVVDRYSGYN